MTRKQLNDVSFNETDTELMSSNNIEMKEYKSMKIRAIKKNNKQL